MPFGIFGVDAECHVAWVDERMNLAAETRNAADYDARVINSNGVFVYKDDRKSSVPPPERVAQ
jgi:hypothetical protein